MIRSDSHILNSKTVKTGRNVSEDMRSIVAPFLQNRALVLLAFSGPVV